jgi:hypothetical protein
MLEKEERDSIIMEAVALAIEKSMLMLPDVIGNLMANHAALAKINSKFYADHPELRDKKDIVASVVEELDSKNPGMEYSKLIELALPIIKERTKIIDKLDTKTVQEPKRNFNGVI